MLLGLCVIPRAGTTNRTKTLVNCTPFKETCYSSLVQCWELYALSHQTEELLGCELIGQRLQGCVGKDENRSLPEESNSPLPKLCLNIFTLDMGASRQEMEGQMQALDACGENPALSTPRCFLKRGLQVVMEGKKNRRL